jgi:hypothetical protein
MFLNMELGFIAASKNLAELHDLFPQHQRMLLDYAAVN